MKVLTEIVKGFLNENLNLIRGVGKNQTANVDLFGRGLYLTDNIEVAKFYGNKIEEYTVSGKIFDTTKNFSSKELKEFSLNLNKVLNTDFGSKFYQTLLDIEATDSDYIGISWALDSTPEFIKILRKNNLIKNDFNSYANVCTAMNMALEKMGYVGLVYSTDEIEDLEDIGLGGRKAYLIFDKNAVIKNF